jgi:hypothetical protein
VAKKKEVIKKLSFDTGEDEEDDDSIKVRPEDFVRLIAENGFPEEWNPYGEGYHPLKPRFINDEQPEEPQFRDNGTRRWEVINEGDPDIQAVYFSLPTPPKDLTLIDGYNLDKDEQYFRRLEIPKKIRQIEKKALTDLYDIEKRNRQDTVQGYKFYLRFWEVFAEEETNLEEEIKWLRDIWWYRTYGIITMVSLYSFLPTTLTF